MSDLEQQTAVVRVGEGKYRAEVSTDWKMWVPVGGYLAAIALRAAQAESTMPRPASITVHYLAEASFEPVDLEVTKHPAQRPGESLRVHMSQNGTSILEALVWARPTNQYGPKVNWLPAPDVPPASQLSDMVLHGDLVDLTGGETFWKNFQIRPIHEVDAAEVDESEVRNPLVPKRDARIRAWDRFMNGATFEDPWVDACRYLILTDVSQMPSVVEAFTPPPMPFIAPTLDLTVEFHNFAPHDEWLLVEGNGSNASDGLLATESRLWSSTGELLVTGYSHMVFIDMSGGPAEEQVWFEAGAVQS
jgi:acyl-CoA thioesterase